MFSYELREQILNYINNRIQLDDLEDWYIPRLRQLLKDPYSAEADVIAAIEHAAFHLEEGINDEGEVKDMLWDTLGKYSDFMHRELNEQAQVLRNRVTTTSGTIPSARGDGDKSLSSSGKWTLSNPSQISFKVSYSL